MKNIGQIALLKMKKYIQPKIEIDELEAKDIVLISDIFNIIGGKPDAKVDQNTTYEDVNKDGTDDKVGNVSVGVGIFGGGGVQ